MATTSGTTVFAINERQLIMDAAGDASVAGAGDRLAPEDYSKIRFKLNLLLKQLVAKADFAVGLKKWTMRRAYVFLQQGQVAYTVGPAGDHATESYRTSTLAVAASGGAGTVTLASASGIASGDFIGIELNTGALFWTTVNGAPVGAVVTLTATLSSAAALGRRVFSYTNKPRKPHSLIAASLRDTDERDVPLGVDMLVEEYEAIAQKTQEGTPTDLYLEAKNASSVIYTNMAPDDVTQVLRLVYYSYIEDMVAAGDLVDMPAEWYRYIVTQLAIDIAPSFQKRITPEMKLNRDEALAKAQNTYPQVSHADFVTDPDEY